jgi:hypothetical protein
LLDFQLFFFHEISLCQGKSYQIIHCGRNE